jgi:hypothetical protein
MTCTCGTIQASDPTRHFKECPERVEKIDEEKAALKHEVSVLREELRKSLNREKVLNENLKDVHTRCDQLINELRVANGVIRTTARCIILKGWTCENPGCRVFNGEEKDPHDRCRSCDAEKPI